MSEQKTEIKNHRGWFWVALIGGIILSLVVGCLVGAVGGFFAGRMSNRAGWNSGGSFNIPDVPNVQIPDIQTPATRTPKVLPQQTPDPSSPQLRTRLAGAAIVQEVVAGSPAEAAGLKVGDIITAVDDVTLTQDAGLADIIAKHKPGDEVTLTVGARLNRGNAIKVKLGQNPNNAANAYLGVKYSQMTTPDTNQSDDKNTN